MKSLGPDAYTNEDFPERKPAHISQAIGEVLGNTSFENPATGANMPQESPEQDRSQSKSNKTTPAQRSPNGAPASPGPRDTPTPPPRSPGRPRSNRIEFFATDTFLRQNSKFIKLKRLLKISEKDAWAIVTSMFCYVAQSQALTPKIDDPELFAEFCYWENDPNDLIEALQSAGFISTNFHVENWFQNQPFAQKKLYDHQRHNKQRLSELSTNFHVSSRGNAGSSETVEKRRVGEEKRREEKSKSSEKRLENVDNRSESSEKPGFTLPKIINDLTQTLKIHKGTKDFNDVNDCIHRLHYNSGDDATIRIVSKIKEQFIAGEIKKPVAYVIGTVNKELESLSPPELSSANQKPTPICPKCNHLILSSFGKCDWCDYVIPGSKPDPYHKSTKSSKNSVENSKNQ